MFVKHLRDCQEFVAGDGSILRELLHPEKTDLQILYSLAYAEVAAGQATKPHKLRTCEVYFITEGQGVIHIDQESCEVSRECAIYIPPRSTQYIENTGNSDLKFLCIVEPAWRQRDEEVFDSETTPQ